MVISSRTIHSASLILVGLLTLASGAFAEVIVSVDRYSVDLNESFILEITLGTDTDLEPDLSVLDDNFYRGQLSQLSNTSIINGQISRSRTWTVALMAKTISSNQETLVPKRARDGARSRKLTMRLMPRLRRRFSERA